MNEFGDNKVDRRRYVETPRRSDIWMSVLGFGMAGICFWVMFIEPSQRTIGGGFVVLLILVGGAVGAYLAMQPDRLIVGARLIDGGFEVWGRAKPLLVQYADIATVRAKVGIDGYGEAEETYGFRLTDGTNVWISWWDLPPTVIDVVRAKEGWQQDGGKAFDDAVSYATQNAGKFILAHVWPKTFVVYRAQARRWAP